MKYKNIKTGAIVDSSSKITGKDWEVVETEAKKTEKNEETQELKSQETEEQETAEKDEEEFVEEEIDLNDKTNKQLEKLAEEQGIKLTTEDKKNKDTRIAAIVKAFE